MKISWRSGIGSCALNEEQEWERTHVGRRESIYGGGESQEGAGGITEPKQVGHVVTVVTKGRSRNANGNSGALSSCRLVTSANIPLDKAVTWLGADKVGGHQRPWQSCVATGKGEEFKPCNSSHRWAHSTTPACFCFCFW